MKKLMVFAVIAMAAGFASAQNLDWLGNSSVWYNENGLWYDASSVGSPGGTFIGHDFGLVASLTFGGMTHTLWNDNGSHPVTTDVRMVYQIDGLPATYEVPLAWGAFIGDPTYHDQWVNKPGVDVIAASGIGSGSHTIEVWFNATDPDVNSITDGQVPAYTASFQTAAVPEPATMALLGLGAMAMVLRRKMSK